MNCCRKSRVGSAWQYLETPGDSLWGAVALALMLMVLTGSPTALAQRRVALLVAGGVSVAPLRFAHQLKAPPNDVRLMADLLVHRFGFQPHDIQILGLNATQQRAMGGGFQWLGTQATRTAILTAVGQLCLPSGSLKSRDYAVVYYSGHGAPLFDPGMGIDVGALVTYEGTSAAAIRYEEMARLLDGCPSHHLTLVLDACFSGLLAKSALQNSEVPEELQDLPAIRLQDVEKTLPLEKQGKVRQRDSGAPIRNSTHHFTTLAACDMDERTNEAQMEFEGSTFAISRFTWTLCKTLWRHQEVQTIEELHQKLSSDLAEQKQVQTPQFRRGYQKSELLAPPLWSSQVLRLPLTVQGTLPLGRLSGIAKTMRFYHESAAQEGVSSDVETLNVDHLDWFTTTLAPQGRTPYRGFLQISSGHNKRSEKRFEFK